jgi:hypothetical protein
MKYGLLVVGVVLLLTGLVWTLQGLNIVKGSFMTGQSLWLLIGLLCLVAGVGVSLAGFRMRRKGS